jgi:protein-tyrosine phosphatase
MELVACHKNPTFDCITPTLYLGDIDAAKDPQLISDINVVVNISDTAYDELSGKKYHYFNIPDKRTENISQFFENFTDIVKEAEDNEEKVIVHCKNSVSRSPTLVLYYLMTTNMSFRDALEFLKSKRTQYTRPNIGFFKQLLSAEKELFNTNSLTVSDYYKI